MRRASGERLLATVLFTDIVGSTERAAQLGDHGWKAVVARHHAIVRHALRRFHGRELDTAGDGFFAMFDRPAQAIECATLIIDDLRTVDLHIRAAIHMGEVEVMGGKVGGLTVHVAARALGQAAADEVIVTGTVHDVAAGGEVVFEDRGEHEFRGLPGEWRLFAVTWQRRPAPAVLEGADQLSATRRLGWKTVTGGLLAGGALTVIAGYMLVTLAPLNPAPVPLPDSAVEIDAGSLAVRSVVPLGQRPTRIAASDGTLWVLSLDGKTLTGIPADGSTPRAKGLPGAPTGLAVGGEAVWLIFGYGATGQAAGMVLRVGTGPELAERSIAIATGVDAIVADDRGVLIANGLADTLSRLDPLTYTVTASAGVGTRPVALALGNGSAWVANAISRSLWRMDPQTLAKTGETALVDEPTALAVGLDRVWIASASGNSLAIVDTTTNRLLATVGLDRPALDVTVGNSAIWLASSDDALLRIDPETHAIDTIALPGPALGVTTLGSSVWVTVQR